VKLGFWRRFYPRRSDRPPRRLDQTVLEVFDELISDLHAI
jgi:hypothetical protein